MGISILTNVASLTAQNNLAASTDAVNRSLARLSSGLRINDSSDDPAGLAVADRLRADARVAGQAIRNANDGVSAINIADKALERIGSSLSRLAELAEQGATGTISDAQRGALQSEFTQLVSEIDRIAQTTVFNGAQLLSSSANIDFQVGLENAASSKITLTAISATATVLGLLSAGSSAAIAVSNQSQALSALSIVNSAIASVAASRGQLGAAQSRLQLAISNLRTLRENYRAAESRIRDVDVAEETANFTSASIRQQAGVAILAQANQQPALALSLLQ
jgi:flagellin